MWTKLTDRYHINPKYITEWRNRYHIYQRTDTVNAWEKKLCNAHHQSAFNVLRALGLRCSRDQSSHREDVKEYGAGRLKRWAAKLSVSSNIGAYFMGGSPQQVQVKYNDVYSVSIGSVNELRIRSITDNVDHYELHIKAPGFR